MVVGGQLHVQAALFLGKEPTAQIVYDADWAPGSVWTISRRDEPDASDGLYARHRTRWAIPPHSVLSKGLKCIQNFKNRNVKKVTCGATRGDLSWLKLNMGSMYCCCEHSNEFLRLHEAVKYLGQLGYCRHIW